MSAPARAGAPFFPRCGLGEPAPERWVMHYGEALAVLRTMPDASVDAIVTDPPYSSGGFTRGDRTGSTKTKYTLTGTLVDRPEFAGDNRDQRSFGYWCTLWLSECLRVAKPGAPICVFSDWRQLPTTTDVLQPKAILRGPGVLWDMTIGRKGAVRQPRKPLVSFRTFQREIGRLLPKHPAIIHTYMYATDTLHADPPEILDGQNLCTFYLQPGDVDAEVLADTVNERISVEQAVAASACLPLVEPLPLGGARFADGGLYSNLPANMAVFQGALGGDVVLCVLATPLEEMTPKTDYVHFRTTVLLNHLRDLQVRYQIVPGHLPKGAHVGPAIAHMPILLVTPIAKLASELVEGFLSTSKMDGDIARGVEQARTFLGALDALFAERSDAERGDERSPYHLRCPVACLRKLDVHGREPDDGQRQNGGSGSEPSERSCDVGLE